MAIKQLESPLFKAVYAAGATSGTPGEALAGGKVYVYAEGTTTSVTTWTDKVKTSENTQPIILDSSGEAEIWFDGVVDIKVTSSSDELQYTIDGVFSSSDASTTSNNNNLISNGSFEIDTDADGTPDSWTISTETDGIIEIDATVNNQFHGTNSLIFTGTTSGGGTATSTIFSVPEGKLINTIWSFKQSSAATGTYKVDIQFYDYSGSATSSVAVWSSTSGAPTTWTRYLRTDSVPSGSTQAKIILTGLGAGGSDLAGSCWFDNVIVQECYGVGFTDSDNLAIVDSSNNEIHIYNEVASAVNEITETNAATGNSPSLSATGDDTNIDLTIAGKGTGSVFLNSLVRKTVTDALDLTGMTAQGDYVITTNVVNVTVAALNDAITLPPAVAGYEITIINNAANQIRVYPNTSDSLNGGSVNSPENLIPATRERVYICMNDTNWISTFTD